MPLSAELERALAGLLNPLRFACENDFTALPRLGSIESMLCRNARHIQTTHSDPQVCGAAAALIKVPMVKFPRATPSVVSDSWQLFG